MLNSKISGVGIYVPDNVIRNNDLESMMNTSDEWIQERTGIKERRWVNNEKLTTSQMGTYASENAIEDAGISKDDIDFIYFSLNNNNTEYGDIIDIEEVSAGTIMLLSKLSLCSEVSSSLGTGGIGSKSSISFISPGFGAIGCSLESTLSLAFSFIIFIPEGL